MTDRRTKGRENPQSLGEGVVDITTNTNTEHSDAIVMLEVIVPSRTVLCFSKGSAWRRSTSTKGSGTNLPPIFLLYRNMPSAPIVNVQKHPPLPDSRKESQKSTPERSTNPSCKSYFKSFWHQWWSIANQVASPPPPSQSPVSPFNCSDLLRNPNSQSSPQSYL